LIVFKLKYLQFGMQYKNLEGIWRASS